MRFYMLLCVVLIGKADAQPTPMDCSIYFTTTTTRVYTAETTTTLSPTTTTAKEVPCDTDDNRRGICVNAKYCNKEGNIITSGINLIPRGRSSNVQCPTNQVCCVMTSRTTSPSTAISSTTSRSTTSAKAPSISTSEKKGCGWRNEDGYGPRVLGGESQVNFGEFPWALPIFKIENNVEKYICGGSLIHPRLVLTYANKFIRKGRYVVRVGEWDILGEYEIREHQTIEVAKKIVHENYNSGGHFNDIAILVLKEEVKLDAHIGFACLPLASFRPAIGTQCIATGWGVDKYVNGTMQNIAKQVSVPYIAHDVCQARLRQELRPRFELHETIMCMGGVKDEDTCKGDGGSPLVCEYPGVEGRYYQAGIVSWGLGCGREGLPGMYSDVAALRSWVDRVVQAEGFDTSYYTPLNETF
ncbi:hypothetical protein evm_012313 [Chilo suppressalis]|nr:hypothetical protein evm_012313 [Chilo suppressalis]